MTEVALLTIVIKMEKRVRHLCSSIRHLFTMVIVLCALTDIFADDSNGYEYEVVGEAILTSFGAQGHPV